MKFEQRCMNARWLGYFDLLGTSELIRSKKIYEVFDAYQLALERLDSWKKRHNRIRHSWFSDTFILYSEDDSAESFYEIEIVCRWFMFSLILQRIPARGSLSCGEFYADDENHIYIGEALLDAYESGENQDWIGFILTPKSISKLSELDLDIKERLNYALYEVPFKKPVGDKQYAACILGNWVTLSDGGNPLTSRLEEMESKQVDVQVKSKYQRTLKFIENNKRYVPTSS